MDVTTARHRPQRHLRTSLLYGKRLPGMATRHIHVPSRRIHPYPVQHVRAMDVRHGDRKRMGSKEILILLHLVRCGSRSSTGSGTVFLLLSHHQWTESLRTLIRHLCHRPAVVNTAQRLDYHRCFRSRICHSSRLRNDLPQRAHIYFPTSHPHQGQMVCYVLRCHRAVLTLAVCSSDI